MNARCEPVYFGDESKKIILGDALTELKKLPAESVDLIFADPPYNIGKNFDGMVESWDEETFLAWLFECIDECHRILKPHGSMYIMNSTENMPYIDLKCRQLFTIKSRIVWSYDSSGVQAKNYFGSMYEPILMMVKDQKNYTFNRDDVLVEAKTGANRLQKESAPALQSEKSTGQCLGFSARSLSDGRIRKSPNSKTQSPSGTHHSGFLQPR